MLKNYWETARLSIASINENISTALEGLDALKSQDNTSVVDSTQTSTHQQKSTDESKLLKDELEMYKKLLEDAQMEHVFLSKQLGTIIATKDTEIQLLKENEHFSDLPTIGFIDEEDIKRLKHQNRQLLQDKMALERSLQELEGKYQASLRSCNEGQVLFAKYEKLCVQLNEIESEFQEYRSRNDSIVKHKTEEIESLVAEYSKLASDCERSQTENEKLVTKIETLEHKIAEFTDKMDLCVNTIINTLRRI